MSNAFNGPVAPHVKPILPSPGRAQNKANDCSECNYNQSEFDFLNLYSVASRPISSQFAGNRRRLTSDTNYASNMFNKYLMQP